MVGFWKVAVSAIALSCSGSASAAFFTYSLQIAGKGTRDVQERGEDISRQSGLVGATLTLGFNADDGATAPIFGSSENFFTNFVVTPTGSGFSLAFTPEPFQYNQVITGAGSVCIPGGGFPATSTNVDPACSPFSYTASYPRDLSGESFSGNVYRVTVTRQEASGREFFRLSSAVPEPSTWALMLAGFGMVGYALRRRPRLAYAA